MIPLPDFNRLFPPRFPKPDDSTSSSSLAEGLLGLGAFVMTYAFAIGAIVAVSDISPWLTVPVGILALSLGTGLSSETLLIGIIEAMFYSFLTFVFTGGLDNGASIYSWTAAGIVAFLFLSATYAVWKRRS